MRSVKIIKITPIKSLTRYNLEIKDNNNYFANKILVHNCRCIVNSKGMWSRQGKPIISAPHISKVLKPVFDKHPDLVLDGELYTNRLSQDFNKLISLARQQKPTAADLKESEEYLQFWIYDVESMKSPGDTFEKRNQYLKKLLDEEVSSNTIVFVPTERVKNSDHLDELYQTYMEQGYEGQMVRISSKPYENKRSKQLLKRKEFKEEEFVIVDIVEGEGNRSGMAGNVLCRDSNGKLFGAGIQGDRDFYRLLLSTKADLIGTLVSIKYQNLTPDGIPRFPVAVKFWKTKTREI